MSKLLTKFDSPQYNITFDMRFAGRQIKLFYLLKYEKLRDRPGIIARWSLKRGSLKTFCDGTVKWRLEETLSRISRIKVSSCQPDENFIKTQDIGRFIGNLVQDRTREYFRDLHQASTASNSAH
jgi:hypothetical protein